MRLTLSILMLVASIAAIVAFVVPNYHDVQALQAQETDYNTILKNAQTLQAERNVLVQKYNGFTQAQLAALGTMIPPNPENVKLILDLDSVASQYGMSLQNVKVNNSSDSSQNATSGRTSAAANADFGTLDIEFSMSGPYVGFTNFVSSLEKSLRIIDVQKVDFTALDTKTLNYQYTVDIQTYWLK